MITFFRLKLTRSIERFLSLWLAVSTEPVTFARERIRLGDTTNFFRAGSFFLDAIGASFLASTEVEIAAAIERLSRGRTSISIARHCDVRVAIHDGGLRPLESTLAEAATVTEP
jgi:hypothetical protein